MLDPQPATPQENFQTVFYSQTFAWPLGQEKPTLVSRYWINIFGSILLNYAKSVKWPSTRNKTRIRSQETLWWRLAASSPYLSQALQNSWASWTTQWLKSPTLICEALKAWVGGWTGKISDSETTNTTSNPPLLLSFVRSDSHNSNKRKGDHNHILRLGNSPNLNFKWAALSHFTKFQLIALLK